jgi:hypothetical protein
MNLGSDVTTLKLEVPRSPRRVTQFSQAVSKNLSTRIPSVERGVVAPLPDLSRLSELPDFLKKPLSERIFDVSVDLKVATSRFAAHLTQVERERVFSELDTLLSPEEWEEGEILPDREAYLNFLRYLIRTSDKSWTSLGLSDEGNVLVAWVTEKIRFTASFSVFRIIWTFKIIDDDFTNFGNGSTDNIEFFCQQAKFYLGI